MGARCSTTCCPRGSQTPDLGMGSPQTPQAFPIDPAGNGAASATPKRSPERRSAVKDLLTLSAQPFGDTNYGIFPSEPRRASQGSRVFG